MIPEKNSDTSTDSSPPPLFHRKFYIGLILLIILVCFLYRCERTHSAREIPSQPLPIVAATSFLKDVPVFISALGTVTANYSVTVRTQINGQLMEVLFKEGQMVKAGDLLAQIDPRPYEAQLTQYEGQLTRDRALLQNAKLDLQRYQTLWKQDSVAKQILDTQASLVIQNEGVVQIDEGLIESTKLNLTYTRITSPIDGRVGLRLVDPGNYVQTSDATGIAVIVMVQPITVVFPIPEDDVRKVTEKINTGQTLDVYAYDRAQKKLLAKGALLTLDNQIDVTTGTVKLKALFSNKDNRLFPNQFVNILLLVNTLSKAILVPTAAIQQGVQGPFVFIINQNLTVSIKPVVTGVMSGDDTTVTGIAPGQLVVMEGADKLTDGAAIKISNKTLSSSTGAS